MSKSTQQPSAAPRKDLLDRPRPRRGDAWIRAHILHIALAILAGGLGGVVLYLLAQAL